MQSDTSLEEAFSLLLVLLDNPNRNLHPAFLDASIASTTLSAPTTYISNLDLHQAALITPAPELRPRDALPQPQNFNDCGEASRSASQAMQQASESIRQASQSVSQASQQAAQSASNEIRQISISASNSIAEASRSMTRVSSSASSAISSAQSAASRSVASANSAMSSAQAEASQAVLQAGAAVAAATGSAAAAGSSFLSAAAKATNAAASSQVAAANEEVSASQNAAITATQAAIAIVGSIIASALLTIVIFFLLSRHKKARKQRSSSHQETWSPPSLPEKVKLPSNYVFSHSDQNATTIAPSQPSQYQGHKSTTSNISLSMFPKTPISNDKRPPIESTEIKSTFVPWNPSNPPKAPRLAHWLKTQESISPFGPINLPIDRQNSAPLGGQLKSPRRFPPHIPPSRPMTDLPLRSSETRTEERPIAQTSSPEKTTRKMSSKPRLNDPSLDVPSPLVRQYKAAREAVWTESPASVKAPSFTQLVPFPFSSASARRSNSPNDGQDLRHIAGWNTFKERSKTPETPPSTVKPSYMISAEPGGMVSRSASFRGTIDKSVDAVQGSGKGEKSQRRRMSLLGMGSPVSKAV